ncbi:MAG TPA: hypothetical protein VFJ51_12610 [Nitrososphaeraceae archaeon]|nr:hypothetical protein [Nitrososphaeraceae archaeon]
MLWQAYTIIMDPDNHLISIGDLKAKSTEGFDLLGLIGRVIILQMIFAVKHKHSMSNLFKLNSKHQLISRVVNVYSEGYVTPMEG